MSALAPLDDVTVEDAVAALDEGAARRLTDRIRGALVLAHGLLGDAYAGRAHEALGYGTGAAGWTAYCAAEFTAEGMVRLPVDQRRAVVAQLRGRGMSTRAIATGLGVAVGTVAADAAQLERGPESTVTSLDGRRRPAVVTTPTTPATRVPTTERALAALLAAGCEGLTRVELGKRLRVRRGSSTPVLSALARQGRAVRTTTYRDGSAVYLHPRWTAGT